MLKKIISGTKTVGWMLFPHFSLPATADCPEYFKIADYAGCVARLFGGSTLSGCFCDDAPSELKYVSLMCYSLATVLQDGIIENLQRNALRSYCRK